MIRFDQCVCGTTTTGTGTLTLAATPVPPGGVDFDVWARATGVGFGNSAAVLVDYEIVEYTSSAFTTAHQSEGGVGTLTLGASAGIANCTLARTTISSTITSMDSQPATATVGGTAITIGTAANTLVLCSPRVGSLLGCVPYFNTTGSDSNWGVSPDGMTAANTGAAQGFSTSSNLDIYLPFRWSVPMLVTRCSWRVSTYSAPTGSPTVSCRIYDINTSGQPGKLLYDFTPSGGVAITATGAYSSGATGNGYKLVPGDYFMDFALVGLTGGSIALMGASGGQIITPAAARLGAVSGALATMGRANAAVAGAGSDPAEVTGWIITNIYSLPYFFGLSPT